MSVGVVIPTFERCDETVRAVSSALAQTLPPQQVVVVDDGSSGATVRKLKQQLLELDVQFIAAPRSGLPSVTRNIGIAELRTDWVAFLDSDDTWRDDKLARQLAVAEAQDASAICTNARRIANGVAVGNVVADLPAHIDIQVLVRGNLIVNSSALVELDLLRSVGGVVRSHMVRGSEDYATWLRVASRQSWIGIDEPLVDYTDEPAATIRRDVEFRHHPSQQVALLDYVAWRRDIGRPLRLTERLVQAAFPRLLRWETRMTLRGDPGSASMRNPKD